MRFAALLVALVAFSASAQTQAQTQPRPPAQPPAPFGETLGGDWGGARSRLLGSGLRLEAAYTGEVARTLTGGAREGAARFGEFDLKLTVDGQRAFGATGLTLYAHALRTHGDDPAPFVGDAQGASNIYAPPRWRLFEAWVQRNFRTQRASLLIGRFDLNAEFYRLDASDLFLNSSFGIGPEVSQTGLGGPSIFPESAFGARLESRIEPLILRAAVLNGVPAAVPRAGGAKGLHRSSDGVLVVGEAALLLPLTSVSTDRARSRRLRLGRAAASIERDSKFALGAWHYSANTADLARTAADGSPLSQPGSSGAYLIGEQVVYRDPALPTRRARVFAQLGRGDDRTARFGSYTGLGIAFVGPIRSREEDEIGLAFGRARNSPAYLEQQQASGFAPEAAETTLELTYLAVVRPWLSVQASLQRIRNPNTDPTLRDANVAQLRFEVIF